MVDVRKYMNEVIETVRSIFDKSILCRFLTDLVISLEEIKEETISITAKRYLTRCINYFYRLSMHVRRREECKVEIVNKLKELLEVFEKEYVNDIICSVRRSEKRLVIYG